VVRQVEAVKASGQGSTVVGGATWGGAATGCEVRQLLAPGTASTTWRRIVPLHVCWLLACCPAIVLDPVLDRLLRSRLVAWGLLARHE
jgi:hypothetical protein